MSPAFILDCSVTMAWCFPEESTPECSSILDRLEIETALVPALWFLEVANVLAIAEKRRRISAAKSAQFLSLLTAFNLEVDHQSAERAFEHILPLCRQRGLSSYDAAYLDLASRRQLPLASLDEQLRSAARSLGVKTLGM